MTKAGSVAAVAIGALVLAAGCQKKEAGRAKDKADLRAQSEGRLQVDQSAVLPVDVRGGVQREYPGATVQNVTKKTYEDRKVRYEIDLTTRDGKRVTRGFDDKGTALKG